MTFGTLSALNQNGPLDYAGTVFATVGASVPNFIMGAFLAFTIVPYVRFVFAQSGIDLDAARAALPRTRTHAPWRQRLGVERRLSGSP